MKRILSVILAIISVITINCQELNVGYDCTQCLKRNYIQLGKAMIECFGIEKVAKWVNNDTRFLLVCKTNSMGHISELKRIVGNPLTKPELDSLANYLKQNKVVFSLCIDNDPDMNVSIDQMHQLVSQSFDNDNNETVNFGIAFPHDLFSYIQATTESKIELSVKQFDYHGLTQNSLVDKERHDYSTCNDFNSAQLFVSMLYQCGQYSLDKWLRLGSTYRLRLRLDDDGTVKQIIRIDTNRNDVPINLKEVLMDYWKFDGTTFRYDCGSSLDGDDHIVTVDFPGRLLDFNKDEPIFKRALYNAVLILNPDIK